MSRSEVLAFFERYRAAFDALDGDAVADLWHSPSAISDARTDTVWLDDAPMRANHRALCAAYRKGGYHRAEFALLQHEPLGPDHAFAHLRWTLRRADGSVLQRFGTGYQLRRTAAGPKVLLCAAYEEDLEEMKRHAAQ
ncbi:MAG: hypothetical protein J0L57_16880 [Burkholderiales bacterium]|nr:hypothetical protein [Burkholderiales bacterium]